MIDEEVWTGKCLSNQSEERRAPRFRRPSERRLFEREWGVLKNSPEALNAGAKWYILSAMRISFVTLVVGVIVTAPLVYGGELLPGGGPVAPDTFSIGYSGTQEAYTPYPFATFATGGSSITGEDLMEVVEDPANVFCADCLDFILQVNSNDTSTANITSVSLSGYAGYLTDAGYDTLSIGGSTECGPADGGYCDYSGAGTPATVSRSADGNVITFDLGSSVVGPADPSVALVIETNATTFVSGDFLSVFGSDSSSATNVGGVYGITSVSSTPEPGTALYLGTVAFASLAGWLRIKRRSRALG